MGLIWVIWQYCLQLFDTTPPKITNSTLPHHLGVSPLTLLEHTIAFVSYIYHPLQRFGESD